MRDTTLCLILKGDQILLAMKKRGFGQGKWNGVGGKLNEGETIAQAAIRETKEEIGVDIKEMDKVAILKFRFPYKEEWNQDVHVFLANNWEGNPIESEEMYPKWFKYNSIPYHTMWDDDKIWLPHVIKGKKVEAEFTFKEGEVIKEHFLRFVS